MPRKAYHVVKRAKDGKWTVKLEGSDNVIKLFDTKEEAEKFTQQMADNQDAHVVVHASKGKNKGRILPK